MEYPGQVKIEPQISTVKNALVEFGAAENVSVTEWPNGEGYDISIYEYNGECHLGITHEGWKALKKAVKAIRKS